MSSVLKSVSQIPVRAKYLISLQGRAGGDGSVGNNGSCVFSLTPGAYLDLGSIATVADIIAAPGYDATTSVRPGMLFKDMGRQITVLDTDDATHLATYREVQLVSGPSTEGVDGDETNGFNANIFFRVWAADGKNIIVAGTG